MLWMYLWLGSLLRRGVFDTNNGNDDWKDLVNPEKYGLTQVQNFYIDYDDDETVGSMDRMGAWFIRAASSEGQENEYCTKDLCPKKVLKNVPKLGPKDTILILLHGNAKNRGASHRIAAYQLFQSQGYHTLTLDYRGYGDSVLTSTINETSVVKDAVRAIRFIRKELGDEAKLVIYGHSMGTAIASHAVAKCFRDGFALVDGIILDSPLHSIKHTVTRGGKFFDYSSYVFDWQKLFSVADMTFDTPKWLSDWVPCPVTVFHAKVDHVVPIQDSEKLVADVKKGGKDNIRLVRFNAEGLGHIGISKDPGFPEAVRDAVREAHEDQTRRQIRLQAHQREKEWASGLNT